MKKYFALVFFAFCLKIFSQEPGNDVVILNNYKMTSSFCDFRDDHFHTGIDLVSKDQDIKTIMDGEVIFYNNSRKDSISYGNGNFVILENPVKKLRVNYSHLKDDSFNAEKTSYKKGESIAVMGNTGASTGTHLHLEIKDMKNNAIINPLNYVSVADSIPPRLVDIYFITADKSEVSLITKGEYKIKKGGQLFINCFDTNGFNKFSPYKIGLFVNGVEKANLKFDKLVEYKNDLITEDSKNFYSIYSQKESFNYYLTDFYSVPGLVGLKVVIEDFYGNKTVATRSILVQMPD
jgi:Peptidase family M23